VAAKVSVDVTKGDCWAATITESARVPKATISCRLNVFGIEHRRIGLLERAPIHKLDTETQRSGAAFVTNVVVLLSSDYSQCPVTRLIRSWVPHRRENESFRTLLAMARRRTLVRRRISCSSENSA